MRDEKDQRINQVLLTDKGHILIDSIKNESTNIFIYKALVEMDYKSLNEILNCLKQLNENLSRNK